MNRLMSLLLAILCTLSLSSCAALLNGQNPFGTVVTTASPSDSEEREPTETTTAPDNGTTAPDDETTVPDDETTIPDTETTTPDTETTVPDDGTTIIPGGTSIHTPLPLTEYYQYSHLQAIEKIAYRRMLEAILVYENEVDISDLSLPTENAQLLYESVVADNPQFFWLANTYMHSDLDGKLVAMYLNYTDGEVVDSDEARADRAKIAARRAEFDSTVSTIVESIDPTLSDYEKELFIHDYLTRTICYNLAAANDPYASGTVDNAFCAHGALIDGSAVCEGYSEAFQYLCYLVGINANQVIGIGHLWNVVLIDGEWYQIDVTWDDPINQNGIDGEGNHRYFNLTSAEMYAAHERDESSVLHVPECTATEYAYREAETIIP